MEIQLYRQFDAARLSPVVKATGEGERTTSTDPAGAYPFDLSATSNHLATIFDPLTFDKRVYRFGGALKADAGASYGLPLAESRALRFFGVVEELFGRDYYESGLRTPGRTARAGAQFNF